ncbi:hypothetical protein [Leisingera caerulea]|uniref:hypothetical protein n=1 Tax=Leisingera caerulea TaxID=506591 RepID=UPI000404A7F7|nr:hypothetical protein [Leisingera caerulea]
MNNKDLLIEPELCLKRGEVVRLIPDVKPNIAIRAFDDALLASLTGDLIGGLEISRGEAEGASMGGDYTPHVITPHGARLLRKLFEAGVVEQKTKRASKDLSALDAYIGSEAELIEKSIELREKRRADQAAKDAAWQAREELAKAIAADPSIATLEDISASMIDRIFIHARGYGQGGVLKLAGCECHKDVYRYVSNSGNRQPPKPYCWWFDPDGNRHGETMPSTPPNRRSDPARNWGAGRD